MRGKKKKPLTQAKRRLIKEFRLWLSEQIELEFIRQLQSEEFQQIELDVMFNGIGSEYTLKCLHEATASN